MKVGVHVVKYMNETKLAAMFDGANINGKQEKIVCSHIHDHFGEKCMATKMSVRMLGNGHTTIKTGTVLHEYTKGGHAETISYSYHDIPLEIKTQMTNLLRSRTLNWTQVKIKRIDIINVMDHGAGAFQAGCQVIIVFEGETSTEILIKTLAKVICQKDNAEVLKKTIEPYLKEGMKRILNQKLSVGFNAEREIECVLGDGNELESAVTPK